MTFWVVMSIAVPLAFAIWCFVWHERGWKRGFAAGHAKGVEDGHAEGHDKGLKAGFEAGKMNADNFWIHAEQDVERALKEGRFRSRFHWDQRKEGWP